MQLVGTNEKSHMCMSGLSSHPSWVLVFCLSAAHSCLLGWGMVGSPSLGGGGLRSGAGRPALGGQQGPQTPLTFWGWGAGRGPICQPARPLLPGPSAPVLFCSKAGEGAIFGSTVGGKRRPPSVKKYMVCEPGRQGARQHSELAPAGLLPPAGGPAAAPGLSCPRGHIGGHCSQTACDEALAGPKQRAWS